MITYTDFNKLDIRIGKIVSAEKVKDTDKLLKLEVDLGFEKRNIVAGIAELYEPEQVIAKEIPILLNLEPKNIRGIISHGMILAVDVEGKPVLMHPEKEVPPGSKIR
ncbi:MAG: methionine--tRNA ligase subunit beta [Nitrospirae bacterium]|nr:methionine--tRNA ligase subunit beta [Nitrospirota bacterium]